jgi:hypothetical protein
MDDDWPLDPADYVLAAIRDGGLSEAQLADCLLYVAQQFSKLLTRISPPNGGWEDRNHVVLTGSDLGVLLDLKVAVERCALALRDDESVHYGLKVSRRVRHRPGRGGPDGGGIGADELRAARIVLELEGELGLKRALHKATSATGVPRTRIYSSGALEVVRAEVAYFQRLMQDDPEK